jgi:hypothetical protein
LTVFILTSCNKEEYHRTPILQGKGKIMATAKKAPAKKAPAKKAAPKKAAKKK